MNAPISTSEFPLPEWSRITTSPKAQIKLVDRITSVLNIVIILYAHIGHPRIKWMPRKTAPVQLLFYNLSFLFTLKKILTLTSGYIFYLAPGLKRKELIAGVKADYEILEKEGYLFRKICLPIPEVEYSATWIAKPETINNGKWVLNALGRDVAMETELVRLARENYKEGANTLVINGPGVGVKDEDSGLFKSGGFPTPYYLGAGFEAGIQHLMRIGATHIILRGHSFGFGMLTKTLLNHDFSLHKNTKIAVISDRTFSKLSEISAYRTSCLVKPLFLLLGNDLDNVAATMKLKELGILHIIIQGENETVIPYPVSLLKAVLDQQQNMLCSNQCSIISDDMKHSGELPDVCQKKLSAVIQNFFTVKH